MAKPPIDLKRLKTDAAKAQKELPPRGSVGTFAAVRAALPAIEAMRAEGIGWSAIAEALAAQGLTQGAGPSEQPITRTRLTSVVSELQKQRRRARSKQDQRLARSDLALVRKSEGSNNAAVRLSDELRVNPAPATDQDEFQSAEDISRARYKSARRLTRDNGE